MVRTLFHNGFESILIKFPFRRGIPSLSRCVTCVVGYEILRLSRERRAMHR